MRILVCENSDVVIQVNAIVVYLVDGSHRFVSGIDELSLVPT